MRNYRDLQVWGKAHSLTVELYRISREFPRRDLMALGSASELDYQLLLCRDPGFMKDDDYQRTASELTGGAQNAHLVLGCR